MTQLSDPLHKALRSFFAESSPSHIAVAVSGGSDSLALLSLLHDWREAGGPQVSAVTVNHGLRAEAAAEAEGVAQLCDAWNVPHETLSWTRKEATGNLHDQARRARYGLMARWAASKHIPVVALGHTQDDQAETFLMRLARGAGVDGLAAMRARWDENGVTFARPVLSCRRDALRDHLRAKNLTWVEDAANLDPTYDRSRIRAALPELGISIETLCDVAGHLSQAREALHAMMLQTAQQIARIEHGDVVIAQDAFQALPTELARRLILASMHWITGADYPPRGAALTALLQDISAGRNATLQGCDLSQSKGTIRITREAGALADTFALPDTLWDGRWLVTGGTTGPSAENLCIRALGEAGLRHCPDRAYVALPARSLIATPAVWQGDTLLAAPLAGLENGWTATLVPRTCDDFAAQISH
ncbi:MAG: tRNA lysidine(34) synthetase TilS [Pseudomonadota bacterium]